MLLIVPLSLYILLYLIPLGSTLSLSVDNGGVSRNFQQLGTAFSDGADRDRQAQALLADIASMSTKERGETARILNQELTGFRSLFMNTARSSDKIAPSFQGLIDFDSRWQSDQYWQTLENNASRWTSRHFEKIAGLTRNSAGALTTDGGNDIYWRIMGRTLVISFQVTLLTLLIGYPLAYAVANGSRRVSTLVLMTILMSFWTSILVRSTAWVVLLQTHGAINDLLLSLGVIAEPIQLIFNRFGVIVSMTHVLLPFAILPMMNVMRTIPRAQNDASRSLGAGGVETFLRVYFPQSWRGVVVGGSTVFILALGFYVTPTLTGGPSDQILSFYIADFIMRSLNWGMASALSVTLLLGVLLLLALYGVSRWAASHTRRTA